MIMDTCFVGKDIRESSSWHTECTHTPHTTATMNTMWWQLHGICAYLPDFKYGSNDICTSTTICCNANYHKYFFLYTFRSHVHCSHIKWMLALVFLALHFKSNLFIVLNQFIFPVANQMRGNV